MVVNKCLKTISLGHKIMNAYFKKYTLVFKRPGGTSRGVLLTKETYFLVIENQDVKGVGECGLFRGLSSDDRPNYEEQLAFVCEHIDNGQDWLLDQMQGWPSIQFGIEQAFLSLHNKEPFKLFASKFTLGKAAIDINGLIWMGEPHFMRQQIRNKLSEGFSILKLKIGALDFNTELELLKFIRKEFKAQDIELRVDANGAFQAKVALEKIKRLSEYQLHSIEQPIKAGQWHEMAALCSKTPLPIALDEELIGLVELSEKQRLLETVKPQYIILKPSLIGGFRASNDWIQCAKEINADWWITSALESNVGLNAIAQYTYTLSTTRAQGLGTGGLFTNNIDSPLFVDQGKLQYNPEKQWNFKL